MATLQSSPLCGPPGLLLLLIGVITSHLPEVQAAPIVFWCNSPDRKMMANMIDGLKDGMVRNCIDSLISISVKSVWEQSLPWKKKNLILRSENKRKFESLVNGSELSFLLAVRACLWQNCACVLRQVAWVRILCPLRCSYQMLDWAWQNGQTKLWVIPNLTEARTRTFHHTNLWRQTAQKDNTCEGVCLSSSSWFTTYQWTQKTGIKRVGLFLWSAFIV